MALGGLTAGQLLPGWGGSAEASPSTDGAGPLVTPNPLKNPIVKSGIAVEIEDFCAPPVTSAGYPKAPVNFLYYAPDGTGRFYANDTRGKIWRIDPRSGACTLFLDLRTVRGQALIYDGQQVGLRSFAFHPDFARAGRLGYRKLYTLSTETPGSRPGSTPLFSGDYPVVLHDVLAEWSVASSTNPIVDPSTRRELLRIGQYRRDHNADQLMFDPNPLPGDPAYGKLFVGVGDGGNVPANPDPYNLAQNGRSLLGKLLRIDPLRRANGKPFSVPADNPFVGNPDFLPAIWALGLRHPQNICFDRGGTRKMIFTDIGQAQIEEVNLGVSGANYGWPLREGTFVTDRLDEQNLYGLGSEDAAYGFTYPVAQYDHDDGLAIAGGFVYRGTRAPALKGHYLCGDIVNGRIFHVPATVLQIGAVTELQELTLLRQGTEVTLAELVNAPSGRVDLRFGQGGAGEVLIITKQDGRIRRFASAALG
jgi:glucose/arabinose dehydrogenase